MFGQNALPAAVYENGPTCGIIVSTECFFKGKTVLAILMVKQYPIIIFFTF